MKRKEKERKNRRRKNEEGRRKRKCARVISVSIERANICITEGADSRVPACVCVCVLYHRGLDTVLSEQDLDTISSSTTGWSGSEIEVSICFLV